MKWIFLVGILGLAIGFFVGRSQESVTRNEEKKEVARSDRKIGLRGGRSREGRTPEESRSRAGRMVREAGPGGEALTEISQARVMKWILELEAADFPEVLESLKKLKGEQNADPFAEGPISRDYLKVAMARWYELEGGMVLDWVLAEPEALAGMAKGNLLLAMMEDGYEDDPSLSFQLMKKYAGSLRVAEFGSSWCYQIGRWSHDFAVEYEEVERLATEFGFDFESGDPDPFGDSSARPGPSLIRGMVDAGREQEVREFFAQKDPEMVGELDSLLENRKLDQLKMQGWQAMKAAIDEGEIGRSVWRAADVLNQWAKEEPEKALAWFLDQEAEERGRAHQITAAVFSSAFDGRENSSKRDTDGIINFLGQMEAQGEPTGEAWGELTDILGRQEQWDDLEKLKPRVSPEQWEVALDFVESSGTRHSSIRVGSGDRVDFRNVAEEDLGLLDRFGIKEQVLRSITEENEQAVRELQEKLEGVGE